MSNYFNAPKDSRQDSFKIANDQGLDSEISGDQGSRLHPVPAVLGTGQKVGATHLSSSSGLHPSQTEGGDENVSYQGTPFGGNKNTGSHVQPANVADARKTLSGENEDPRLC